MRTQTPAAVPRSLLHFGAQGLAPAILCAALLTAKPACTQPLECGGIAAPQLGSLSIGSPLSAVQSVLGPPTAVQDLGADDSMGFSTVQVFSYSGLEIVIIMGERELEPTVAELRVTQPFWVWSNGLHVGMAEALLLSTLGPPQVHIPRPGYSPWWRYYLTNTDGWLLVSLGNDRILEIRLVEDSA